jgi:hypothetical protein
MGRLTAIPGFAGTKTNPGFAYDENSALRIVKTDNGITMEIPEIGGRDKNDRLREMLYTSTNGNEVLRLTYDYDKANNIVRRNDNTYVYDELNRLQRATIEGVFEDKFIKEDMNIGQADQDYHGEKEPEANVTEQTEVKLDYSARSLIFNLRTEAENISRIELVPMQVRHRVPVEQIEIYYKQSESDPFFTKLDRSAWTGNKDAQGRITIKFKTVPRAMNMTRWEIGPKRGSCYGKSMRKNGSNGKVHYVPLLNEEVGYRKEFSSNAEYSFIYVGGQHFARVDGVIGVNGKKYFYHNDHLGSALAVTDEHGNKVVERDFTPFGERINPKSNSVSKSIFCISARTVICKHRT